MFISNNFSVQGLTFAQWFNQRVKPYYHIFENFINEANFAALMAKMEVWTGKEEITLQEFCAHLSIMYNETGGLLTPIYEMGGQAYCFNRQMPNGGVKYSYNRTPNRLAGDQLLAWGVIAEAERQVWNGQIYPYNAPLRVQQASAHCDYYRFRGWGLNQLTWRNAYESFMQPHLPKPLDEYEPAEWNATLEGNLDLACKVFRSYTYESPQGSYAMAEVQKENFVPYGNMVSGGWAWYVYNKFLPRVQTLLQLLENAGEHNLQNYAEYAIDGMNLTPAQIRIIQANMNAVLAYNPIVVDGFWGNASEGAFKMLEPSGATIQGLLNEKVS